VRVSAHGGSFEGVCELVGDKCHENVVAVYKNRPFINGRINDVVPGIPTDSGDAVSYYDVFVKVEPI